MTGQVKEDVLCRFGELGVFVNNGMLQFNPRLLRSEEFLEASKTFTYSNVNKEVKTIQLEKDTLCFTYCQIPIIYNLGDENAVKVDFTDGKTLQFNTHSLDTETSKKVFSRTGEVETIMVSLKQ